MTCNERRQVYTAELNQKKNQKNQIHLSKSVSSVYNAKTQENHPMTCNGCKQEMPVCVRKKNSNSQKNVTNVYNANT